MIKVYICFYAPRKIEIDLKFLEIKLHLPKESPRAFHGRTEELIKRYFKGYQPRHEIITHKEADYVIDFKKDRAEFLVYCEKENDETFQNTLTVLDNLTKEFKKKVYIGVTKKNERTPEELKMYQKIQELANKNNVFFQCH